MRLFWPITLAAAALVGLLAYGVFSKGADRAIEDALASGKRPAAPTMSLPVLGENGRSSLADYKGKVVVLNVWASWCDPCREEVPLLQRLHQNISGHGGVVLGVDTQDASGNALDFLKKTKATFPSLRDRDRTYGRDFGVTGYPETFLIDRKGRVAALRRQPVTPAGPGPPRRRPSRSRRRGWIRSCPGCWRSGHEAPRLDRAGARAPRRSGARPTAHARRPRGRGDVRRVRDAPGRLPVAGRQPGARVHPAADRRRQEQGSDQGRAGRGVRRPGARRARRRRLRRDAVDRADRARAARRGGHLRGRPALAPQRPGAGRAACPGAERRGHSPPRRRAGPQMSGGVDTTVIAAFAVGFVSFISPCVLPLVPGYLSAVSGITVAEMKTGKRSTSQILF